MRASSVISGLVNRKITTTSSSVVRPRVKAKPCTLPTDTRYSTAAHRKDTKSETRMVRRARGQARCTAGRSWAPSRTSSRMRSKYTMNESAVMPIATIAPQTAGRFSAKPTPAPSRLMIDQVRIAETTRPAIEIRPRPR